MLLLIIIIVYYATSVAHTKYTPHNIIQTWTQTQHTKHWKTTYKCFY